MSNIRILPEHISNRIAAGEVIERPASVVKELVENAVDAGATSIKVEIEKAGKKLIMVTDNGNGMDADDAIMCLEPHATSKIREADDIDHIITLGFRGEAVPSIASVSRFYLKTRKQNDLEGTEVVVRGGKVLEARPAGCAPGTEISVRDLFFNTPARKKFLRTDSTEEKHIQEMLYMLSLPYPSIAFELLIDGRRIFSSPAHDDLLPRIKTYFGKSYADNVLRVGFESEGVVVQGYTARHGLTRNTRREQRTFVNGRPVESLPIYRGLRDGYGGLVEKGRFPPAILFIKVDPHEVDVNVHPAKREIRLRHEYKVSRAIAEAIRIALRQAPAPSVTVDSRISLKTLLQGAEIDYTPPTNEQPDLMFNSAPAEDLAIDEINAISEKAVSITTPEVKELDVTPKPKPIQRRPVAPVNIASTAIQEKAPVEEQPVNQQPVPNGMPTLTGCGHIQVLGFLDRTYILAVGDSGLIVIDQHAAHERVMFERLLKGAETNVPSQQLLLPITLELSRAEAAFVTKNHNVFSKIGFEIEPLSSNTVMLSAIPASLEQDNIGGLISDMLSTLLEEGKSGGANLEIIARTACKAAVKAHDNLTLNEAQSLLHQMSECDLPFSCPHGRPTIINISIKELEKRFGRK
jgi:DNA mismatch repair protein MutL